MTRRFINMALAIFGGLLTLGSCSDEIDESNLYTFTGETIEDFLANREDYSSFNYILDRAGLTSRMSAYGSYTCFAPNNTAVTEYIDSLYNDEEAGIPHNGMTENSLEGLSDSLCQDIALYHLANTEYMGVDMSNGLTILTMLGRDLNSSIDSITGLTTINTYSAITTMDNELENGVLHEINHVLRRSNSLVAGELEKDSTMSIFSLALKRTGLVDSLADYKRTLKEPDNTYQFYTPTDIQLGYTLFVESDAVFEDNGIHNFDELVAKTKEWYGNSSEWYDYVHDNGIEVSTGDDYTNPFNTLNMFIRYHILKFKASYDKLNHSYNEVSKVPLYDYYETMLPYTLVKIEKPSGQNVRYLNPYYRNNTLTDMVAELGSASMHTKVDNGAEGHTFITISKSNKQALNGYLFPIDRILVYDKDVPNGVLNERMRFDTASLFGELMSTGLRGIPDAEVEALNGGNNGSDGPVTGGNGIRCVDGFFDNFKSYNGENTRLYYCGYQSSQWFNLQGDEFHIVGAYDCAFRLPPVPKDGTYEIRIGYTAETKRGMVQFYLGSSSSLGDMKALDIPLDMRHIPSPSPASSWVTGTSVKILNYDGVTGAIPVNSTDDQGVTTDASMRNKGYMRGLLYYTGEGGTIARMHGNCKPLRRIVARQQLTQGENWLRLKNVLKSTSAEFHLDYIEIVPANVYNNSQYAEDMY